VACSGSSTTSSPSNLKRSAEPLHWSCTYVFAREPREITPAGLGGLRLGLQRLDHLERELQVAGLAAQPLHLAARGREGLEQELILRRQRLRDPLQLLEVLLALEIDVEGHALY